MTAASDPRRGRNSGDPAPFLARSRLFRDASAEVQAELARFARRVAVARGALVCRAGDAPEGLFVVAAGHVALSVHRKQDREKVIEVCAPEDSFGEECIAGGACAVSARAASAALLVHLPQQAVLEAMARYPVLARCILRGVSRKILQATHEIGDSATRSGVQRLAGYLLRCLERHDGGPASVTLAVPKRVIASLLGVSSATFSRLLAALAERGLIEVSGRRIRVPRPEALVALCHDGAGCATCGGCPHGDGWIP